MGCAPAPSACSAENALHLRPWALTVVLYHLGPELLDATVARVTADLAPGGLLLAVHWTGVAASHPLSADAVHRRLLDQTGLRSARAERHPGYRLDLLERAP